MPHFAYYVIGGKGGLQPPPPPPPPPPPTPSASGQKADAAYLKKKNLEKKKLKYSKQNGHHIEQFSVRDSVSVRVPRIDRTNTDVQRLSCALLVERPTPSIVCVV